MPAVFYPACKIRLQIRFEDYLDLPPVAVIPTVPGAEAFGLGAEHAFGTGTFLSTGIDIIPLSCTVERNSYRKADQARFEISFAQLPMDPRIIRAMTVQVFGGTFTPTEFAAAVGPVGAPGFMLPDAYPLDRSTAGQSTEIFRGFADKVDLGSTGDRSVIEVEARDLTSILLDNELKENAVKDIPGDVPLDVLIQQILFGDGIPDSPRRNGLPGARGLVIVNETGGPLPAVSDFKGPQWLDSKRSAKKGRKNPLGSSHKISYWDLITDLCISAGFICFIRTPTKTANIPGMGAVLPASELVISRPRTYYADDPTARIRKFIHGLNTTDVKISKKFGGVTVPVVEVRSFDVVSGKQLRGRWPPVPESVIKTKNNKPSVSGLGDNQEVKVFVLDEINFGQGIPAGASVGEALVSSLTAPFSTTQFLKEAARSIYEQLARGEQSVSVKTKNLAGFEEFFDDGIEADLFLLQAGETVMVEIATAVTEDGQVSALRRFASASVDERIAIFMACGFPPSSAAVAAAASVSPKLQKEFRTQAVVFTWNADQGWEVQIDAINFLDVRDNVKDAIVEAGGQI